ncbi:MAG: sulfurtransferase [bacterium]|nr:sulfurtransferase [bacterium]
MTNVFTLLLVSTQLLPQLGDAVVVDVRPGTQYAALHIAGALHMDPTTLAETRDGVKGLLKPVEQVTSALGEAGIDPKKHIVVYCAMNEPDDFHLAARLFWILEYVGYPRVSILDGGFAKWRSEKRPTGTGWPRSDAVTVTGLQVRSVRLATLEQVDDLRKGGGGALLDMRPAEFYKGKTKKEAVQRAGHIPGATSTPATTFTKGRYDELKPVAKLNRELKNAGVSEGDPVITYCDSGRSGSIGYFVGRLAGVETISLYDGSMAEWASDAERPVATGKDK